MANSELPALAAVTDLAATDILYVVVDPGGGGEADKKITAANLAASAPMEALYVALTGNQSIAGDKTFEGAIVMEAGAVVVSTVGLHATASEQFPQTQFYNDVGVILSRVLCDRDNGDVYIDLGQHNGTGATLRVRSTNSFTNLLVIDPDGDATLARTLTLGVDNAYGSGWNASLKVPTENAVYDKIETLTPLAQTVNAQTGTTYTLDSTDAGKLVTLSNASAITLTVPQDSDETIAVGTYIDLYQLGAGQVTVVAGSGATLRVSGLTAKFRAQYARAGVQKVSANTWSLFGDLAAS